MQQTVIRHPDAVKHHGGVAKIAQTLDRLVRLNQRIEIEPKVMDLLMRSIDENMDKMNDLDLNMIISFLLNKHISKLL